MHQIKDSFSLYTIKIVSGLSSLKWDFSLFKVSVPLHWDKQVNLLELEQNSHQKELSAFVREDAARPSESHRTIQSPKYPGKLKGAE